MNSSWGTRATDVFVRKRRIGEVVPVTFEVAERRMRPRALSSPLVLILLAFITLIVIGTVLLSAPFSHHNPGFSSPVIALFTATSAVTVTGLVVVETSTHWTTLGHGVILLLMFVGGLGFMSLAAFLLAVLGQRVSIAQRLLIRETLSTDRIGGLQRLSVSIVLTAVAIQIIGFFALFARLLAEYEPGMAAWQSLFHAVSGFNNAGFVIFPEHTGMAAHQSDNFLLAIMGGLIVLGTLSFWVVSDIATKRKFSLYSLVSKIVLLMTGILITVAAAFVFVSEGSNPQTLGQLPIGNKIAVSVFEGISGRTAGFSTFDYAYARPATDVFISFMMFIGGATASVAGGIKVTTFFIVVLSIYSIVKEKSHVTAFGREIDRPTITRSYAVLIVCLAFSFFCTLALAFTNSHILVRDLAFESVSAFGTVGLSTGATAKLNMIGQLIVTLTMLAGRIGPLLIGLKMVPNQDSASYRHATETVTIG